MTYNGKPTLEEAAIKDSCPWCNGWGFHKCPGPDDEGAHESG